MIRSVFYKSAIYVLVGLSLTLAEEVALTEPVKLTHCAQVIGINGSAYQSFVGIPFAEPPINTLRFANPVPKAVGCGTFYATTNPAQCIQMNFLLPQQVVMGEEDCLYLNVYRPNRERRPRSRLPVMVYIHGGAFFSGSIDSGIHGPGYFMRTGDVILVMMQYRLSTLGFLSTGDGSSPGNFGLKDQALGLKWTKNNIAAFGGDPNKITIFGQSAGAASVHMHMMSPLSQNQFSQAIAISGNALGAYNYPTENPLELARKHAALIGIENADQLTTKVLVDRLREIPADELISSVTQLKFFDVDSLTVYRTVVEPKNSSGAFLTDTPLNLLRAGKFVKIPYMSGLVEAEGAVRAAAIIVNENLTAEFNDNVAGLVPKLMELQLKGPKLQAFTEKIINRYLPGTAKLTPANEQSFLKMYSDRSFEYPHYKQLQIMTNFTNMPIYTYFFDYRGQNSYSALFTGTLRDFGVVHCDDLIYLFESPLLFPNGLNQNDTIISRSLLKHYVTFAKHRQPWRRSKLVNDMLGPYMSLVDSELKYYDNWEMVRFWDQAEEF